MFPAVELHFVAQIIRFLWASCMFLLIFKSNIKGRQKIDMWFWRTTSFAVLSQSYISCTSPNRAHPVFHISCRSSWNLTLTVHIKWFINAYHITCYLHSYRLNFFVTHVNCRAIGGGYHRGPTHFKHGIGQKFFPQYRREKPLLCDLNSWFARPQ